MEIIVAFKKRHLRFNQRYNFKYHTMKEKKSLTKHGLLLCSELTEDYKTEQFLLIFKFFRLPISIFPTQASPTIQM